MPRVSVLMPTHDRSDLIGHAIGAVLRQSAGDFELLVVGDGCTDRTAAVVAGFDDPRIRWFDLPKGPGFAYANRNVALREARGELIGFAADDDLLFPDHLERLSAAFSDPAVSWAYSRPLWVSKRGVVVPASDDLAQPDQFHAFMHVGNSLPASCVMHRRACFEEAGYWPEDATNCGDWDLWTRILAAAGQGGLRYLREPTTLHFRARWRTADAVARIGWIFGLAHQAEWWPAGLRLATGDGPEQAAFAEVLSRPDGTWVDTLRAAVPVAVEQLARRCGDYLGEVSQLREEVAILSDLVGLEAGVLSRLAEGVAQLRSLVDPAHSAEATVPPSFDEASYLVANPDVGEAVAAGTFRSGFQHWLAHGRRERRLLVADVAETATGGRSAGSPAVAT